MSEIRAMGEQIVVKNGSFDYYIIPRERVEDWNKYVKELQTWLEGPKHYFDQPKVPDFAVEVPTGEPWNDAVG